MQDSMIRGRCLRGIVLLLAAVVLFTGLLAAGARHDHGADHHADCLGCRLVDGFAGTLPELESEPVVVLATEPFQPTEARRAHLAPFACNAHRLRAPPTAA